MLKKSCGHGNYNLLKYWKPNIKQLLVLSSDMKPFIVMLHPNVKAIRE